MVANKLISIVVGVSLHDYVCSFKAYHSEIAKSLPLYGEMHRFIPVLASIEGARISEIPVTHHLRRFGKCKYNLSRTFRVILDLLTVVFLRRFVTNPLYIFGGFGLSAFLMFFFICAYLAVDKVFFENPIPLVDRPILDIGALFIVTGIQLLSTGTIAEMFIRTYFESQDKTIFRVKELYGSWGGGVETRKALALAGRVSISAVIVFHLIISADIQETVQSVLGSDHRVWIADLSFIFVYPAATLAVFVPISLNGIGSREAAYVALFQLAGLKQSDALAFGLM